MFTNELMGRQGPEGSIQTGAFRGWRTADGSKVLRRNLGPAGTLLQISDIDAAMATTDFRQVLVYTAPSPDTLITLTPVDLRTGRAGASNSSICPDRVPE
ncbi:hypothetical protein RB195_012214 [Necator americanus]|uniref:Uncharacterized protein n=1 Tax=Necator americanus TaxID=51031 RepID=A0ABR1D632_NECAM